MFRFFNLHNDTLSETIGRYILKNKCTIREAAKYFNRSKSAVHIDVSKRLEKDNYRLYKKVKKVLDNNFNQKHIRGGQSTKNKWVTLKEVN